MSHPLQPSPEVFDRWAEVYDTDSNTLLLLEDRIAPQLLPSLAGKSVLDIGCGTGRWLQRFEAMRPSSLAGIDCSAAMLAQAERKLASTTELHLGDCQQLPFADGSFGFILCSFTLSYVEDLSSFARECARVLAPGGVMLLSDMHPNTALEQHWTRSFSIERSKVEIATPARTLREIEESFAGSGLRMDVLEEPSFGIAERKVFENAARLHLYERLLQTPAIYLMQLQKPLRTRLTHMRWSISASTWNAEPIVIEETRIAASSTADADATEFDLCGYVLLPGLLNAHDHLEFALFPNLGRAAGEAPYRNAAEWAHEIHRRHADMIALHRRVPLKTRLWWGAIRNLLCGVTTVCHHNPLHTELADPAFPVHIVTRFGWAHSLAFDDNLSRRFEQTPSGQPFILHAAEGVDDRSHEEPSELRQRRLLDDRTVLVHGLALSVEDIASINDSGASLILCPTSNQFLFHHTVTIASIETLDRVALGSDSPLTAAGDLLDEIHHLHQRQNLTPVDIYNMVTTSPASILKLRQGEGSIELGGPADLIAVRDLHLPPAETLSRLSFADIELVMISGKVQVASQAIYDRLPEDQRKGLQALEVGGSIRYLRAPIDELIDTAEAHLGPGQLRLGQKAVRCVTAL